MLKSHFHTSSISKNWTRLLGYSVLVQFNLPGLMIFFQLRVSSRINQRFDMRHLRPYVFFGGGLGMDNQLRLNAMKYGIFWGGGSGTFS